jgi:DNA-binding transcriptional MerR regulator
VTIQNKDDARYGQTIEVPVYNSAQLGEYMERTAQTIRLWERKKVTPPATWRDGRGLRLFSEDQVKAYLLNKHYADMPMKDITKSVFKREINKMLSEMPDGVKVVPAKDFMVSGECARCHSIEEKRMKGWEAAYIRCSKCGGHLLPQTVSQREL